MSREEGGCLRSTPCLFFRYVVGLFWLSDFEQAREGKGCFSSVPDQPIYTYICMYGCMYVCSFLHVSFTHADDRECSAYCFSPKRRPCPYLCMTTVEVLYHLRPNTKPKPSADLPLRGIHPECDLSIVPGVATIHCAPMKEGREGGVE